MTFDELVDKVWAYRQQVLMAYSHLPPHERRIVIYLSYPNSKNVLHSGNYSSSSVYAGIWHEYMVSRTIMGYPVYVVGNSQELTHPEYQLVLLMDPMDRKPTEYVGDKDEINPR